MANPLHNDTREALLKQGHAKAAAILDGLYAANINPGEWVARKAVPELIPTASQHQIRDGLADSVIFECQRRQTGKRGQPEYIYRVPDRDALRRRFVPTEEQHHDFADRLPAWAYKKTSEYKKAMFQAFMERRESMIEHKNATYAGFTCPTAFLAEMLDVSPQTVRNYKRVLQVQTTPQFTRERITEKVLNKLPTERNPGKVFMEVGTNEEVREGRARKYALVRDIATLFVRAGLVVWQTTQTASKLHIPQNAARYCGNGMYETGNVVRIEFGYQEAAA